MYRRCVRTLLMDAHVRACLGAHTHSPARLRIRNAFMKAHTRCRADRYAGCAGVRRCVGVQREHRRLEHGLSVEHGRGMYAPFLRLLRPSGATAARPLGPVSMRMGRCVWRHRSHVRVQARSCVCPALACTRSHTTACPHTSRLAHVLMLAYTYGSMHMYRIVVY